MQCELLPDTIIFAVSLEHLIEETMGTVLSPGMRENRRLWARNRLCISHSSGSAAATVYGENDQEDLALADEYMQGYDSKRTFLCGSVSLCDAELVPQSSTE